QYYHNIPLTPHAPYQFQSPQPFPSFQSPQQIHHPQQIQQPQHLSHQHSPYGQQPPPQQQQQPSHQQLSASQTVTPQIPSQAQTTSPSSRKRKAPGSAPAAGMVTMAPSIGGETNTTGPQADVDAEASIPTRPPKKNRTNTPWSPAEEQLLRVMRDANKSWGEIAKDMHYAEFAEDESQALLNAIKEYEASKWKVIGQKVGKPAKVTPRPPFV
ncbi:MAG: hypothetical protein Q9163_006036, partial [Psora crenata]